MRRIELHGHRGRSTAVILLAGAALGLLLYLAATQGTLFQPPGGRPVVEGDYSSDAALAYFGAA